MKVKTTFKKDEKIKVISFDLDGTLVDHSFADAVWIDGMAKLYCKKTGIDIEKAKKEILRNYDEIGDHSTKWYDLDYWFSKLNLEGSPRELMEAHKDKVRLYDGVKDVLENLCKKYRLVLFSNAYRPFMEIEIEQSGIGAYFEKTVSSVSDFERVKDTVAYTKLCSLLGVSPEEVLHVGDHEKFDHLYPSAVGIRSLLICHNKCYPRETFSLKDVLKILK